MEFRTKNDLKKFCKYNDVDIVGLLWDTNEDLEKSEKELKEEITKLSKDSKTLNNIKKFIKLKNSENEILLGEICEDEVLLKIKHQTEFIKEIQKIIYKD